MSTVGAAHVQNEIRRLYAPEFESEHTYHRICRGCGERFLEWKGKRHKFCPACALGRQLATAKVKDPAENPLYVDYARGMLRYWLAEAERLGISLDP